MRKGKMAKRAGKSDKRANVDNSSDMQLSDEEQSDVEMELEEDAEEQPLGVEAEVDDEDEEDEDESVEEDDDPPTPPLRPPIKIKLKLPAHMGSVTNTTATPTPVPEDGPSKSTSRRTPSRDIDVESEDDDNDQSRSTPSTSAAGPSGRPMTTRQAVLASVVDSTHVSLSEGSRKKKALNESELALRREETARKRKNMSEKKLEDEKAETINRLLKKQSRAKNKRNALASAEDRTPVPNNNSSTGPPGTVADDESDAENGNGAEPSPAPTPAVPVMYRWVSRAREEGGERKIALSFSVPTSIIPLPSQTSPTSSVMDVDYQVSAVRESAKPECDVHGCFNARKYKLVKDWTVGACGMAHLKMLEANVR